MKSTTRALSLSSAALLLPLALVACATTDGGGSTDAGAEGKTVCFVTAAAAHPYVTPANDSLNSVADGAGVEIVELSQEFDVQTGTDQLNTCIGRGVDGIILWPLDPEAYTAGLQKASEAGIPVIVMNSPVGDDAAELIQSFTGPDPYETGTLAATLLNDSMGGEGDIVVISGQAGNGTSIATEKGFTDTLADLGSKIAILQTVYADFDQQTALVASRDLITRFGEQIDGVFTIDDGMAHGFIDAWAENGSSKVPFVTGVNGQKDAFDLIRAGSLTGTVLQSPVEDGRVAMETMIAVLNGDTVDKRQPIPLPVITLDNIDEFEPAF